MSSANIKFSPVNIEERRKLDIRAGDTVRVSVKIQEKGKTRLQAFEGVVIARKHGAENGATFTVRKVASGVGTERIFPLYSPNIEKIEIKRRAKVRRAKLYYIRDKATKEVRRKMRRAKVMNESYTEGEAVADGVVAEDVVVAEVAANNETKEPVAAEVLAE